MHYRKVEDIRHLVALLEALGPPPGASPEYAEWEACKVFTFLRKMRIESGLQKPSDFFGDDTDRDYPIQDYDRPCNLTDAEIAAREAFYRYHPRRGAPSQQHTSEDGTRARGATVATEQAADASEGQGVLVERAAGGVVEAPPHQGDSAPAAVVGDAERDDQKLAGLKPGNATDDATSWAK